MSVSDTKNDPFLEKKILNELENLIRDAYKNTSVSKFFSSDKNLDDRLYRKLYNSSEITISLSKIAYIRRNYLEPYYSSNSDVVSLDRLKFLENAYELRLLDEDGRGANNVPAPQYWSKHTEKMWSELVRELDYSESMFKDHKIIIEFILDAVDKITFKQGSLRAKTNAWIIVSALEKKRFLFPTNSDVYQQVMAYACTQGIYQSFVTEDLRTLRFFRKRVDLIRKNCRDSLPEISYQMSLYYEDRIINGAKSNLNRISPCSEVITNFVESPPKIYIEMKWDHHAYFRHLNDELLAKNTDLTLPLRLRAGMSLHESLRNAVKIAISNKCDECEIGTSLSLALCELSNGNKEDAHGIATLALEKSKKLPRTNSKTKARAFEAIGIINNAIYPEQGNSFINQSINEYLLIRARYAAHHAEKNLSL